MKKLKHLIKKVTITFCASLMAFGAVPFTALAEAPESDSSKKTAEVARIQWVYKTVKKTQTVKKKGKKKGRKKVIKKIRYKRLYNFTQREWVSGWIRIK